MNHGWNRTRRSNVRLLRENRLVDQLLWESESGWQHVLAGETTETGRAGPVCVIEVINPRGHVEEYGLADLQFRDDQSWVRCTVEWERGRHVGVGYIREYVLWGGIVSDRPWRTLMQALRFLDSE